MKTNTERNSLLTPLLFVAVVLLILCGIGLELAYLGGVFTGKNQVMANDKRIESQAALIKPAH